MRILPILLALTFVVVAAIPAHRTPSALAEGPAWTKVYDRAAPNVTSVRMFDSERGLAVIGLGVERTTDGGATWTEPDPDAQVAYGHIAYGDAEHAWVAGVSGVILRTEDGGLSWHRQQTGTEAHFNAITAVTRDEAWATAYGAGFSDVFPGVLEPSVLLHTVDGGATWSQVRMSDYGTFYGVWFVGNDGWLLASQCKPGDPVPPGSRGGVSCNNARMLLHSVDGGATWSVFSPEPSVVPGRIERLDASHAYGVARACDVAGCTEDVYSTRDGGRTWERRSIARQNAHVQDLRFTSLTDGWVMFNDCSAGCGLVLAHTEDGGGTWSFIDMPPDASGTFDVTPSHVVAGMRSEGVRRYDRATGEWRPSATDARPGLASVTFTTRTRGYAVTDGTLMVSDDGGVSWAPRPPAPERLAQVVFAGGALWAPSGTWHLVRSDDDGWSWRPVEMPAEAAGSSGFRIQSFDARRAWLTLTQGLWRSDDGGSTWQLLETSSSAEYTFTDPANGWTASCGTRLCHDAIRVTGDGGATWETRSIPRDAWVQFFVTRRDGWGTISAGVESDGIICPCVIATHDGGRSWQTFPQPEWELSSLHFVDALQGWALGDRTASDQHAYRTILSTRDGGRTWVAEAELPGSGGGRFATAGDRAWLPVGISGDPWSSGRGMIYRRDIGPAGLRPPDTGAGPMVQRGVRGWPALAAVTLALLLAAAAGLRARSRRRACS